MCKYRLYEYEYVPIAYDDQANWFGIPLIGAKQVLLTKVMRL